MSTILSGKKKKKTMDPSKQQAKDVNRYSTKNIYEWLIKYEKMKASKNLYELHRLRKKADYKLFNPLTEEEINNSIKYMENVLNELKFEN